MHVEINENNNTDLYATRWEQINREYAKEHPEAYISIELEENEYVPNTYYYQENNVYVLDTSTTYTANRTYYTITELVHNLADYYAHIEDIKDLGNGKFLFMPLDEEPIFVNTDTRKLTIPSHFSTYGLSVCGDNHAEMIFFKMPRYFDYHDLARDDLDIGINWQILGTKTPVVGSSAAAIVDTTLFPNYVLFGWLITSDMTAEKASIKFAVEVCTKGTLGQSAEQKTFSFNTVPAVLNIAEGLIVTGATVLTLDEQQDVLEAIIKDSVYTEESLPTLARPVVITSMAEYTNMPSANTSTLLKVGFYSETLKGSSTSATLNYQWIKPDNTFTTGTKIYVADDSGRFNNKINYYEYTGNDAADPTSYTPVLFANAAAYNAFLEQEKIPYIEMAAFEATTPGHYRCIAMTTDTVDSMTYNSRSNYNNTTILGAFKPEIIWMPSDELSAFGDKYVEYDQSTNTYILYEDTNTGSVHPITIKATPTSLVKEKEFVDVTGETLITKNLSIEENRDYLGKLTYGVLDATKENFDTNKAATIDKVGTTETAVLTILNVVDNQEIALGAKHFKNNDIDLENVVWENEGNKFITYYYPSSIEDLKFTVGTLDGTLTAAIFELSNNSNLTLKLNTESLGTVDTNTYVWHTPAHGEYKYIWEYKKGNNPYVAFTKFTTPNDDNSGKTIILNKASFEDGFKAGDIYKIRLRIECHNGNRIYKNTDGTFGIVSQNDFQVVGTA